MRRKDREIKEFDEIIDVLSRCKVLHLALISDGKPYAVPVNFGFAVHESEGKRNSRSISTVQVKAKSSTPSRQIRK